MFKAYFDLRKNVINIEQDFGDMKEISDTISVLIERVIIDTYIKPSPKIMAAPIDEIIELVHIKKNELIN